jgi:phosphopantothenate-cysteine ligase
MADIIKFLEDKNHCSEGICLITSGPTSVPIDPVRSIENFSTGTRGARLAEYFLEEGWSVIFLYRENSVRPFRHRISIDMDS